MKSLGSMNKAVEYALFCTEKNNEKVPKYVKIQAAEFLDVANGKDKKCFLDLNQVAVIENILKIINQPEGECAGQSMYNVMDGYQWLMIIAVFCIVWRSKPLIRRYRNVVLEICRKNYKTTTIAICFIILFLIEPRFSEFFSVAPSGKLSREVKKKIEKIIKSSPLLYYHNFKERFSLLRDSIEYKPKETKYFPLNYSINKLDSMLPTVYLADEVGALPNISALESMRSGQLTIENSLGFVVSTKYENLNNPFEDEVAAAKAVLDGLVDCEDTFALLFEPDSEDWMTNDNVIYQSNPVAVTNDKLFKRLIDKREEAIRRESLRPNYLTKHNNIIYQGAGTESYIDVRKLVECRVDHIDWSGREVYVGVDMAISVDNCSVVMMAVDEQGNLLIHPMAFFPADRLEEKIKEEGIDYQQYINSDQAIACGGLVVDYKVIEDYVFSLAKRFGVAVMGIGYDRMNCMSSAQKWDEKYETTMIRQHSDTLHEPTKLLEEKILNREVRYVKNQLYEINFENARVTEDANRNKYVHKKKSRGKVDMVFATLNALYLLNKLVLQQPSSFVVQM